MSDTGKMILWIVVAAVVIAVVIWLFVSAGRRREVEARRFEAGELRAKVEERLPRLQDSEDRASVTAAMAADARVEAEQKAAEAKRLEQQAEQHRASAEEARAEHVTLEREADRVDPDVPTDAEGYRLDERGERLPGQEPSRSGTAAGAAAGAAGTAAVGAAAFTHDDEEDDLADAENPFAPAMETTSSVTDEAPDHGSDESSYASEEPEVTGGPTSAETAWAPSETADDSEAGADEEEAQVAGDQAQVAGDEAGDVQRDEGSLGTGEETDQSARDERDTDVSDNLSSALDADDEDNGAAAVGSAGAGSAAGPDEEATQVRVPALEDRDDVLADGGTPDDDPGDHRGQAWATTPGTPGPGDSAEPADEGIDVDMAPHSHESDETDEPDEAAGSTAQEPRREEAEPAPDVAAAAYPDTDASTDTSPDTDTRPDTTPDASPDAGAESDTAAATSRDSGASAGTSVNSATNADETATAEDASPSGRRVSAFDEVVDGGFGLGSAAPIGDGAQPLGHAVKGTRDGQTFLAPDDAGYDDLEPDVWFYNEDAARRAGFHREGD